MRLGVKPYRLWSRYELPKKVELDDWEGDDDWWIRRGGEFYNIREFCTVGCPHISGPMGGAQVAAGDFLIAGAYGEVWPVIMEDSDYPTQNVAPIGGRK